MALTRPTLSVQIGIPASGSGWLIFDDATTGKFDTGTFGDGPSSTYAWTDITDYVYSINTRRGRQRQLESFQAGTLTITLDNSDRRFDPTNLSGPYVVAGESGIAPMLPVQVIATNNVVTYPMFRGYADSWDINWNGTEDSVATLQATDGFKVLSAYNQDAT